ncbi:shikimate dehydrogenase [Metasolibacillus sp. FSL H7-0170]|uniref:shikimate dehydrogenase family protein n=1 Tax=Metasolibacillus sp. FSL H7-0170 TaxID=2921431 RepID=UPI0007973AC0|nr:shikimate dehydrogenase [[Bacillus] sp. KCTC 13219]
MFSIPQAATVPTMYFIGVTTTKSSIMKIFPEWVKVLGFPEAKLVGIDLPIHAAQEDYRAVVKFIKNDPLSLGALVTTHKIDIYAAAKDLFDELDEYAQMFGELSCISKRNGMLVGHAKDPISSGLALQRFIPEGYWQKHNGEVMLLGAGGSAIAISSYLLNKEKGNEIPKRMIITDLDNKRLEEIKHILQDVNSAANVAYHLTTSHEQTDELLSSLPANSLVINATGLGKDRKGSPISDKANFPQNSFVWELNYRGELDFLHQAENQKQSNHLHVEDGWIYFIHGWTQVIAEVFDIQLTNKIMNEIELTSNDLR